MSLESLHADGIEAAIQRQIANPTPAPGTSFRMASFLSSGLKGLPAGIEEALASATDFLSASGAARAYASLDNSEEGNAASKAQRESAPNDISIGNEIRAKVSEWKPDPITAHTADQVLFGLTRVAGKATAAVTLGGPVAGGTVLAAEETNTQSRDLVARGIDPETALKVAGVQGVVTGATVGIPMVGSTVGRTVALGIGTGPAAFVAQETVARKILEQAGYRDEALSHDPLDPLGLALSTILPAAFGGAHIAGLRGKAKPIGPIAREADIKDAVALTPAEQQISDAFERSSGNLKELRDAVAAEKNPANKAVLEAELAKQTEAAANAVGKHVIDRAAADRDVVDAARVRTTSDAMNLAMPHDLEAPALLERASDDISAGRMPDVKPLEFDPEASTRAAAPEVWYSGSPQEGLTATRTLDEQSARPNAEGQFAGPGHYTSTSSDFAGTYGGPTGRLYEVESPFSKPFDFNAVDPATRKSGKTQYDEMVQRLGSKTAANAELRSQGYDAITFTSPRGDKIANVFEARPMRDVGSARAPVKQSGPLELAPMERPANAPAGREFGENALPPPDQVGMEPVAAAKTSESAKPADVQRAEQIVKEAPDAQTVLPGSEKPMSVEQALERAAEEHKLEASEADLVKAALECALGFGA